MPNGPARVKRDAVIGWGNVSVGADKSGDKRGNKLLKSFGYANGKPTRDAAFRRGLEEELQPMRVFLGLPTA